MSIKRSGTGGLGQMALGTVLAALPFAGIFTIVASTGHRIQSNESGFFTMAYLCGCSGIILWPSGIVLFVIGAVQPIRSGRAGPGGS